MKKKNKIIVILGQTSAGKSNLAVKIARKINGEIISADSRQVYRGLDIGTGKITKKEMRGIPHHLINVASPKRVFSADKFKKLANKEIKEIIEKGKIPIICGGTGFYIDTITKGIVLPKVPPNKKLRKDLSQLDTIALTQYLKKLDPKRGKDIDKNNKVRLIRAIEIAKYLGKVPKIKKTKPKYKFIKIGLYLPKEKLKNKITERVNKMFKDGLLNEIKKLKKEGISNDKLRQFGFEYFNPTKESVTQKSVQYAKRQLTWFKRDKEIFWFDGSDYDIIDVFGLLD